MKSDLIFRNASEGIQPTNKLLWVNEFDKKSSECIQSDKKSTAKGIYRQVNVSHYFNLIFVYNIYFNFKILLTVIVSFEMISLAQMLSYPAQILPQLRNDTDSLYMNADAGSWYTSINSLLAPVGSLAGGIMMDRYGRRVALLAPLIPMILSWTATAVTQSYYILFISRAVLGICGGFGPPVCQVNF